MKSTFNRIVGPLAASAARWNPPILSSVSFDLPIARRSESWAARLGELYEPDANATCASESPENLELMRQIDRQYLKTPAYSVPRMTLHLQAQGCGVDQRRVARLMRLMGMQVATPNDGPRTSSHMDKARPYLLIGKDIDAPRQVWCADITFIPLQKGYLYLAVVLDWFSRYVVAWELARSMEDDFCVVMLNRAFAAARPGILNTDYGAPFTTESFTGAVSHAGVRFSMDGRGRTLDNAFIERLWRTLKQEDIYPREYPERPALHEGLTRYFKYYNDERPHSELGYETPSRCHMGY